MNVDIDYKQLFLDPSGRIGRGPFWLGVVLLVLTGLVLGLVPLIGSWLALALLFPWFCILSKRLRDIGRTPSLAFAILAPILFASLASALMALTLISPALTAMVLPFLGLLSPLLMLAALAGLAGVIWVGVSPSKA